ncbi:MAG: hypothetical protein E6G02_06380 [Actinobacteria bacterium]|nr:MAG: hypothetical protein E6G02_06380 [Actinomycetota bacterium]
MLGLLHAFSGGTSTIDGWALGLGDAAALSALLLLVGVFVRLRPGLPVVLVRGLLALLAGYFALAVFFQTGSIAEYDRAAEKTLHFHLDFHLAYGAYLGLISAGILLLAAALELRPDAVRESPAGLLAAVVLTTGLLVAFLLPWRSIWLGVSEPAAVVTVFFVLCVPTVWARQRLGRHRLGSAAVVALFTGAVFSSQAFLGDHVYGAWLGLGFGLALVLLAFIERPPLWDVSQLPGLLLALGTVVVLLISSLFLPWQKTCFGGQCVTSNGWDFESGSGVALLAVVLAVAALARYEAATLVELAAGLALLTATLGFELVDRPGVGLTFAYGSTLGFAGAGLLVLLVLARARPNAPSWGIVGRRLLPIGACIAYLSILVVPWWTVLPDGAQEALALTSGLTWLTMAGALLGIHLLGSWLRRPATRRAGVDPLVAAPIGLVAVVALELIRYRGHITWGGGALVGLGVFLASIGIVENRFGLANFRVPEILRVDRL